MKLPLVTSDTWQFDAVITVAGGGMRGQAVAPHGIARALCLFNLELRPALKKQDS